MKALPSLKTISVGLHRKTLNKVTRPIETHMKTNKVVFASLHELILKIEDFPITITFDNDNNKLNTIIIYNTYLTLKNQTDSLTLSLNSSTKKWFHLVFGQQIKKVQINLGQRDKKDYRTHIFTSLLTFRSSKVEEITNLIEYSIQPALSQLKSRSENRQLKQEIIQSKTSLSNHLKSRFSERSKHTIASRQFHKNSIHSIKFTHEISNQPSIINHFLQKETNQSNLDNDIGKQSKYSKIRDLTTSNSIRETNSKLLKVGKQSRQTLQNDAISSEKYNTLKDISEIYPKIYQRPKFYQESTISQEQIQRKRKKFDSQFIMRKDTIPINETKPSKNMEQSQVTEDICKGNNSRGIFQDEDTLEKGLQMKNNQESGTLYESVYQ